MSITATSWAARQQTDRPADKLVLWAMADQPMPVGAFRCFAAVSTVVEFTGLDRKTVLASQARLKAAGLIVDTGERRGATKQIIVWRLALETEPKTAHLESIPETERSQKRNCPASSHQRSQKRDTDPDREPDTPSASPSEGASADIAPIVRIMAAVAMLGRFLADGEARRRTMPTRSKRGSRLPDGWRPGPLVGLTAEIVARWEPGRLERVLDSFGNHHAAKGSLMVNWDAAFRTWVSNEEKFSRDRSNGAHQHRRSGGSIAGLGRTGSAAILAFGDD